MIPALLPRDKPGTPASESGTFPQILDVNKDEMQKILKD
jgi:hypothetical protein